MRAISTWHPPRGSVHFSLKTDVVAADVDSLVVAEVSRVIVFDLTPVGLKHRCAIDVWGTITSLRSFKVKDNPSRLFVTTDLPSSQALVIEYQDDPPRLEVIHSVSLHSRAGRQAEFFQGAIVDPKNNLAITSNYIASLKVFQLDKKTRQSKFANFECRIPELNVRCLCFVPTPSSANSTLAILYTNHKAEFRLLARQVLVDQKEISVEPSFDVLVQDGAHLLVPIPGPPGGLLILGGGKCMYYSPPALNPSQRDKQKGKARRPSTTADTIFVQTDYPHGNISTYALVSPDGSRVLLADEFGQLSLLALVQTGASQAVTKLDILPLGEISSPKSLTYLTSNVLYVGSFCGDSQLIRVSPQPKQTENGKTHVEVLETFNNIAPIMDAIVTDLDGSEQVVTCSGALNCGSIRVVRNGANIEELAVIENMPHVTNIWPIRNPFEAEHHSFVIVSTIYNTRLFLFHKDNGSTHVEECDGNQLPGLARGLPTIAVGVTKEGSTLIQVTKEAVITVDLLSGMEAGRRSLGEITAATINPTQLCVALKGGSLVYFAHYDTRGLVTLKQRSFTTEDGQPMEISALSINSTDISTPHTSKFVAVAFWGSNKAAILKLPSLETIGDDDSFPSESHLPRSVLLHSFGSGSPHLLVGLADGGLAAYVLDPQTFVPTDRKIFSLGSTPISLTSCASDAAGQTAVFACSNAPAVLFHANGRLQHSPLVLKGVIAASALHVAAFPDALIFATTTGVLIGRVRELQNIQIHTTPFGLDNPRRIAHHNGAGAFGVGCVRTELPSSSESESFSSSFKILNETTFQILQSFSCEQEEKVSSVSALTLACGEDEVQCFVVGTVVEGIGKPVPEKGRILIFEPAEDKKFFMSASVAAKGCVWDLAVMQGKLVAAVNSRVTVYELRNGGTPGADRSLAALASWHRGYVITKVVVRDNKIVVIDALRSLSTIEWAGGKLETVSQDLGPLWPMSLEMLDDQDAIVAEAEGNIFTYKVSGGALEREGSYSLGELVNKFCQGKVSQVPPNSRVRPNLLFFTSSGRIATVSDLDSDLSLLLSNLQRNMEKVIKGPGGIEHATWRSPVGTRGLLYGQGSVGFIDGDYVESFLELDPASPEVEKILQGENKFEALDKTYAEVGRAVEELQFWH
ncbi:hypothetical protein BOTBODRAFT_147991 [Botryobasidium botryosum FD-172 SS1]|uniref:DNA damage-binding protein 1 n=1 Tax=Botryobasidium botryosum (strain FD-172 SS1) TaxID=930990 RepID=A0A067MDG8_BOTB1|nr:hypothetical protein BOTBODRAFT_147991 [Botryobasidium botryosum FD-172 SS1]